MGATRPADGDDFEDVVARGAKGRIDVDALAAGLPDEGARAFVRSGDEPMVVIALQERGPGEGRLERGMA